MITIKDWYNENEVILDIDRDTFNGWYYNQDYTKIYIDTDNDCFTWDCIKERLI